ncbi:hypothetical protein BgiMline_031950, partial [Biomphalaria glabrata]
MISPHELNDLFGAPQQTHHHHISEIQTAARLLQPGELATHAVSVVAKTIT